MAIRRSSVLLSLVVGGIGAVGLYLGSPGSVSLGPSAGLGSIFFDYNPYAVAPALPTCTVANSCTLQCKASTSGAVWQCTKGDGTAVTVTQGTGSSATTGPQGIAETFVDDTTAPTITSANLGTVLQDFFASDHTVVATGGAIAASPSAINYLFRLNDGAQAFDMRHESGTKCIWVDTSKAPTNATILHSSSEGVLTGYSFLACRKSGTSYTAYQNTASTSGTWAQVVGSINGTTAYFGRNSATTSYLNGPLQSVTFYAAAKTDAELTLLEDQWQGVAPGTSYSGLGFATFHSGKTMAARSSDGKYMAFGNAVPRVVTGSSAGLIIDEGVGTNASWAADPTSASTWTAVGTPTTTANQASGPFSYYRNGAEADLVVDDDAGAFEGYSSVRSAGTAAGKYTAWCWVRSGTSGVTTDKVRISVVAAGGTSAGSADCDFSGLTSTFEQKKCVATITGTATTITGKITVGNAVTDTGSVIVSYCQIDDDPWINDPHFGDTAIGVDDVRVSNTEVDLWPTTGGDITVAFTPNFSRTDLTPSPDTDDSYEIFDLYDNSQIDHRVLMWHYNYAAPAIATRGSGQPTTSTDTYASSDFSEVAGTKYAFRVKWKKCSDPTFSKHWVYLDTCADPNTCLPTTPIGSDESCTKYSPTTTDWGGVQVGCRYSRTVCMLGTIHHVTVRTTP